MTRDGGSHSTSPTGSASSDTAPTSSTSSPIEVDILFANENEICTLYEVDDFDDALQNVLHHCEVAALTRSEKGRSS